MRQGWREVGPKFSRGEKQRRADTAACPQKGSVRGRGPGLGWNQSWTVGGAQREPQVRLGRDHQG